LKLAIQLTAAYRYEEAVSFSAHIFRLFPRLNRSLRLISSKFQTNESGFVSYHHDLFNNEVAKVFYPEKSNELKVAVELEFETTPRNPFDFLLDDHALNIPISYTERERKMLAPFLEIAAPVTLPFWKPPELSAPTTLLLVDLNTALFTHITYERREVGEPRSSAETLALGTGSCRDFMVLHADVLRTMGVATRLASGYICELESAQSRADGALHAWVEVYLPGAGWIGLDATNGVFCNHNHIPTAVGLKPCDIASVSGNYFANHTVASTMEADVKIQPLS